MNIDLIACFLCVHKYKPGELVFTLDKMTPKYHEYVVHRVCCRCGKPTRKVIKIRNIYYG